MQVVEEKCVDSERGTISYIHFSNDTASDSCETLDFVFSLSWAFTEMVQFTVDQK